MTIGTEVLCLSSRVCCFLVTFLGWMLCDVYVFSGGYLGFWGDVRTWEERESEESKFWTVDFLVWRWLGFCKFSWFWGLLSFSDCAYCVKGDGVEFSVHLKVKFSLAKDKLKMRLVFFLFCGKVLRLLCCTFFVEVFCFSMIVGFIRRWCCWIFSAFKIQVCTGERTEWKWDLCLFADSNVCLGGFVDFLFEPWSLVRSLAKFEDGEDEEAAANSVGPPEAWSCSSVVC